MDKSKIIKLLSLSQSDNDHEALASIRMANKILKNNDLTWEQFLGSSPQNQRSYQKEDLWELYREMSEKIEYILNNYPVWFDPQFVRDLGLQLKIRGKLSPKQVQAINKIYYKLFRT